MAELTFTQKLYFSHAIEGWKAWLHNGPARWSWLQRLYAWTELFLGLQALKRGRPYRAADHFCKASRRVKVETLPRAKARDQLKRFFQAGGINGTLKDFRRTLYAAALRARFLPQPFPQNVTFRGNLMPLKAYDPATGEKGVLIMTFNYLFQAFHAIYDTERLRDYYWMVLEPSYHHFEDVCFSLFSQWDCVLEANNPVFRSGLQALRTGFGTVPLTSADWTDSDFFAPLPGISKQFDLIYVANWSRNKAHEVLFRALKKISRPLRVALVGFTWERTRRAVEEEMKRYGVSHQCNVFENIPPGEVNQLLNASRVNLLLSRREGGNKALYEAMFADVPSVVYRHCEGLDPACVNPQTGLLVDDHDLTDGILDVLRQHDNFSPRDWALRHTGYQRATRLLNRRLRELALSRGQRWSSEIAAKANRPEFAYKSDEDVDRLRPVLEHLACFLRYDTR